jgi:hypothetical protein
MINEAVLALQEGMRPLVDAGTKLGRNPFSARFATVGHCQFRRLG